MAYTMNPVQHKCPKEKIKNAFQYCLQHNQPVVFDAPLFLVIAYIETTAPIPSASIAEYMSKIGIFSTRAVQERYSDPDTAMIDE